MRIPVTDHISYIKSSEEPLSADVGIIEGKEKIWLFDVGSSESALRQIEQLPGQKAAVLSHFHPDHIGNLEKSGIEEIYLGANTYGYTHQGTIVDKDFYIEDGVHLHIFPLPSSHARGCLGLEVDGAYAFLGDAIYSTMKGEKAVYNATILAEELRVLEKLEAKYVFISHRKNPVQKRETVLRWLQEIYAGREKGQAYIEVSV